MTNSRHRSSPSKEPKADTTRGLARNWRDFGRRAITNLRQSRSTSLHEDRSDNEIDSPHFRMGAQHSQTRRRIKEFPDIRALDELVQRRIQEAKMQLRSRLKQAAAKVSDSLLFKEILECEFLKKFTTPTFDYSESNDPIQYS